MKLDCFETKRLILRKFIKDDLEDIYRIYSDLEVNRFLPWFPLKTREEAKDFYEQLSNDQSIYHFAICLKENNRAIGYVHVSSGESYDLGYGLRQEFWHRGIVTEACEALITQLKREGIPYITATHDVNNPRSGQVMKRLGMTYQYSYQEQWQPKNILVTFRMYQLNLDGHQTRVYNKYWNESLVHYVETDISIGGYIK